MSKKTPQEPSPLAAVSSPDLNAERLATLKKLCPDLFSNEGRLNVDELKKLVDPALVSETERYDFRWYGKTKSKRDAFTPSRAALVLDPARSVNPDKAGGNLIIEGENLEVLKLLTSAYREQIKCIYIDPPYNTGNDFVYSDNFAEGQKPYWEQTGVTESGLRVDTNTESDGRFHSNWLSMMHSRLLVARYLLKPEGVIFVSIDDGEVHNLRRIMDEIFGEENFLACIAWEKRYTRANNAKLFYSLKDTIIAYRRTEQVEILREGRTEKSDSIYANPDKDPRGVWTSSSYVNPATKEQRPNLVYPIQNPFTGQQVEHPTHAWKYEPTEHERHVREKRLWWGTDGDAKYPRLKVFLSESDGGLVPVDLWDYKTTGTTDEGGAEVKALFGEAVFDNPKPTKLVQRMLKLVTSSEDCDLVLDFFGGSGTTAQAVMELNKADGGNRKFILVQLPELTSEDSPAHKAGFKRISDITIERAKRVVQRLKTEAEGVLPNDPQKQFADSLGFKVFTLAKSHFPRVEFAPDPAKTEAENIELLKQYIREKEATFDIQFEKDKVLDEVLLKNGFMLDYTLTAQPEFKKNEVWLAKDAFKESLICLDRVIAAETVDHFKAHKEHFFICLELALTTTTKWNLKHNLGEKLKAI